MGTTENHDAAGRGDRANKSRIAQILQWICGLFLAFVAGTACAVFGSFPYELIGRPLERLSAWLHRENATHWYPIRYPQSGVSPHDPVKMAPGLTLLTSYWPDPDGVWRPGVRLVDDRGRVVHAWATDPMKIWPQVPYADPFVERDEETYVHGTYLFPNGDVLFNLEYIGLQRIDACGKVVWKTQRRTHHAISRADDGTFWTLAVLPFEPPLAQAQSFPALAELVPFPEDSVLHFTADGKILGETSTLRALFDAGYGELITRNRMQLLQLREAFGPGVPLELTHTNDVEPLTSALAPKFPMFEAGDLLVSMRQTSAVFVMAPTGHIKWLTSTHTISQHDPDFEPDGKIVVFDNHIDGTESGEGSVHGTTIVAIDPATDQAAIRYPTKPTDRMYSVAGGKHQLLPNGNRLITEARAGRVVESDAAGNVVWQWVQAPRGKKVAEVLEATRYAFDASAVAAWPCAPDGR